MTTAQTTERLEQIFGFLGAPSENQVPVDPEITRLADVLHGNGHDPVAVEIETEVRGVFERRKPKWETYEDMQNYLHQEQVGCAKLLAKHYGDRLLYDHAENLWHFWNGQHWQRDLTDQVRILLERIADQFIHAAGTAASKRDKHAARAMAGRAAQLHIKSYRSAVLDESQSLLPKVQEWDSNPLLLGCANATIDLRTGTARPGRPADYIRDVCPTQWQGIDAKAQRWQSFILEIFDGDKNMAEFVQRLLGYGISGLSIEHKMPLLYGRGRNGKDKLLSTLQHTLGPLASPVQTEVLLSGGQSPNSASPHVHALMPLRLAWCNESDEAAGLSGSQVKLLTGGGIIACRPLYGKPVTFTPKYLLMMSTNFLPRANSDDYALFERVLVIPFELSFVPDPDGPNERLADPYLLEVLKREASGVLAWLVRGFMAYQERGLDPPGKVLRATAEYQDSEDVLQNFFDACCILNPNACGNASDLYAAYKEWIEGQGRKPLSQTLFGRRLGRRFERKRVTGGMVYVGITLAE